MRKIILLILGVLGLAGSLALGLTIYGFYLDSRLRRDVHKLRVGMSEDEVIQILGKPSYRKISDIPGTYWTYNTKVLASLIDDNPDAVGYLVLEMGADGKVVKVFDLK